MDALLLLLNEYCSCQQSMFPVKPSRTRCNRLHQESGHTPGVPGSTGLRIGHKNDDVLFHWDIEHIFFTISIIAYFVFIRQTRHCMNKKSVVAVVGLFIISHAFLHFKDSFDRVSQTQERSSPVKLGWERMKPGQSSQVTQPTCFWK